MPAIHMGGKAVLDSGSMVVTGDVTLNIPALDVDLLVEFRPGVTGAGNMRTASLIHFLIGADISAGWQGDIFGGMGVNSADAPPLHFIYNVGSSRPGSAVLTWTVTEF